MAERGERRSISTYRIKLKEKEPDIYQALAKHRTHPFTSYLDTRHW